MEEKKFCKFCGAQIDKGTLICPKCGKQLDRVKDQEVQSLNKKSLTTKEKNNSKFKVILFSILGLVVIVFIVCICTSFKNNSVPNGSNPSSSRPSSNSKNENVNPEFKDLMDSSEKFFDEYIAFIKKYSSATSYDAALMAADYSKFMLKYTDYLNKINSISVGDLSTADYLYYTEVYARIMAKLAEINN